MTKIDASPNLEQALSTIFKQGMGSQGIVCSVSDSGSQGDLAHLLTRLLTMVNETYRLAEDLSLGRLDTIVSRDNVLAMPLRALQSNLRHLTWQAEQIASGDLSQTVHFLGEFSKSFNIMITALREKAAVDKKLRVLTNVLGEGVLFVNPQAVLTFMNPEAERILGFTLAELQDQPIHETIHVQRSDGFLLLGNKDPLTQAIVSGQEYSAENINFKTKAGCVVPISVICRPSKKDGVNTGTVISFRDITEQKKYQESLELINTMLAKEAGTDALTGLWNRHKFTQVLVEEIRRTRSGTPFSIILFDIDHFKSINDHFGHLCGDQVLKKLARILSRKIRSTDLLVRWGGEEFILLIRECHLDEAVILAEKIRALVEKTDFELSRPVTISLGVTSYVCGDTENSLIHRADQAMNAAKKEGRNRVQQAVIPQDAQNNCCVHR